MANAFVPEGNIQSAGAVAALVWCALHVAQAYGVKGLTDEICTTAATSVAIIVAYIHDVLVKLYESRRPPPEQQAPQVQKSMPAPLSAGNYEL